MRSKFYSLQMKLLTTSARWKHSKMEALKNNSLLLPIATTITLYLGSLALYRLLFHPLAKFPGSKLAAIIRYYEGYYDIIQNVQKANSKAPTPKRSHYSNQSMQEIDQAHVNKLCDQIAAYAGTGRSLNLDSAISAFTGDVSTEFLLGKLYNNLDREDFNAAMTEVVQGTGAAWRITKHFRWNQRKTTKEIMAAAFSSNAEPSETIIPHILQSKLPPEEKDFEHISEEVSTVAGTGLETFAQALRVLFYYIYSNAKIIQRLRTELCSLQKETDTQPTLQQLEQLPYLTSVLMETLRLNLAITTRMTRIAPDRELIYNDMIIPLEHRWE
ncbi:hypothetical protein G7Y89_g10036 [Cudoniella acicularis]|uniref:Cytochrome P450 n=1 Tax=Cudoniella acicularis TaxID=354080 RepID=A0A8H4RFU3_9HELO|nr:hypothetical protein G7Y89_g10036 [Cudoniella acicularis]